MLSAHKTRLPGRRRWLALALTGTLAAGIAQVVTPAPARAAGPADHVDYWNEVLLQTFRETSGIGPGPLARAAAIMHVSMYDAANSVLCAQRAADCLGQPYAIKVSSAGDFDTAVDYAAHDALTGVFGGLGFTFDDELAVAQSDIPASADQAAGRSVGQQVATAMLQRRSTDHSDNTTAYTPDTAVGAWRPATAGAVVTPNWGSVTPFVMTSGAQFRPPIPGGYTSYAALLASDEYTEQFNEVKAYGAVNSTVRSADQTQAAFFWANDVDGTYKPPGQLLAHTQIVADAQQVPVTSKVKLYAQVSVALADAAIMAWDRKFLDSIDLWRPDAAIRQAASDGNPDTTADPSWQPLSADRQGNHFSPAFPAFTSGHATFAYTWAAVMAHWFGRDNVSFTGTTDDPHAPQVRRTFAGFSAAADENAHSRLWLGVHWHWDADSALDPATELGEYSVDNAMYYNRSSTELLYLHKTGVTNRNECDNTGRQLSNEHRWEFWRCVHSNNRTVYDLYVH